MNKRVAEKHIHGVIHDTHVTAPASPAFTATVLAGAHSCRVFPRGRAPYLARKSTVNTVVAPGFSSMIQWPESGTMPIVTFVATTRRVSASAAPNDLSPPNASTGI